MKCSLHNGLFCAKENIGLDVYLPKGCQCLDTYRSDIWLILRVFFQRFIIHAAGAAPLYPGYFTNCYIYVRQANHPF